MDRARSPSMKSASWIKEQVGETRSTVYAHRYADSLLKNTSTKHNQYIVNIEM